MATTRRHVLQSAAASVLGASLCGGSTALAASNTNLKMRPLDYGLSFICHTAAFNAVRFWVESRTRIINDKAKTATDYYQCASCKSEHTFAEKDLFQQDNYDFLPILGGGHWLIFRRHVGVRETYRTLTSPEKLWGEPIMKLREAKEVTVLDTWEAIRDDTADAIPIVTQTEIANPETGLRAIIECPVKTMNISLEDRLYQVDTGPVAYPDLAKTCESEIDCLSLAFIALNAPGFADFVVEQPTPIIADDAKAAQTYHYSSPFSLPAKNLVLALGTS